MERGSATRSNFARQNAPGTVLVVCQAGALRVTDPRSGRETAHDAVRANLGLPDFFENLAGNHELIKNSVWIIIKTDKGFVSKQPCEISTISNQPVGQRVKCN